MCFLTGLPAGKPNIRRLLLSNAAKLRNNGRDGNPYPAPRILRPVSCAPYPAPRIRRSVSGNGARRPRMAGQRHSGPLPQCGGPVTRLAGSVPGRDGGLPWPRQLPGTARQGRRGRQPRQRPFPLCVFQLLAGTCSGRYLQYKERGLAPSPPGRGLLELEGYCYHMELPSYAPSIPDSVPGLPTSGMRGIVRARITAM